MAQKPVSFGTERRLANALSRSFSLIQTFSYGYRNREDITTLPPGVMVQDSQNVLTNVSQRVGIRKGYTLDGQANTDLAPIGNGGPAQAVFDWQTTSGEERNMRAGFLTSAGNDGKLQFRTVSSTGVVTWVDLVTSLTSVDFNYITVWDVATLQVLMLCVNGESNIRAWSGGFIELTSGSANPTGIIGLVAQVGDDSPGRVSGGKNFIVGDTLAISGGNNDATIKVIAVAVTGQINTAVINAAGSGYAVNDEFTITGGTGGNFHALGRVTGTGGGGSVSSFTILNPGQGYSTGTNAATVATSGGGAGLTIDISTVTGGGITDWEFVSDPNHGTGYTSGTKYTLTGGTGTLAYIYVDTVKSGSILKSGTTSWAGSNFTFGGGPGASQTLLINGVTYTYDAGDFIGDTTTLYGVTPDPSSIVAGDVAVQEVVVWANGTNLVGLPASFKNNFIATIVDGVFIGSKESSVLYISDPGNFTNYTTSGSGAIVTSTVNSGGTGYGVGNTFIVTGGTTPAQGRVLEVAAGAGGAVVSYVLTNFGTGFTTGTNVATTSTSGVGTGFTINITTVGGIPRSQLLTSPPTALIPQAETLYASAGKDEWYKIDLVLPSDLSGGGRFVTRRIQTTQQQASRGQGATTKIANQVAYLSFEPIIEAFGPVQDILGLPQMVDLSHSIVNLMNAYDFTGAGAIYFRKMFYLAVPREGVVLIYNMTDPKNPYWEAPQVMPIARFSIIDGELYGHSSQVSETYKLFDGYNDNGALIVANATFSFNNYGSRATTKGYNTFYVEGYISANTVLDLGIQFDIDGCATNMSFEIDGDDRSIVCIPSDDASLGKTPLGKHPLGSSTLTAEDPLNPKFRVVKTFPTHYFYEDQISFQSEGKDFVWEIIAFGPQMQMSGDLNNSIQQ